MATENDKLVLQSMFSPLFPFGQEDVAPAEADLFEEPEEIKQLKTEAATIAEQGDLDQAYSMLTAAIEKFPTPALYNDRAQVLQLKGLTEEALKDLDEAINRSKGLGKTAGKSFAQRGLIKQFKGDEDGARDDYKKAAELGNEFAKKHLVSMNPMAALCNRMLTEVMHKLMEGKPADSDADPSLLQSQCTQNGSESNSTHKR